MKSFNYKIIPLLLIGWLASCKASEDIGVPDDVFPEIYRGSQASHVSNDSTILWNEFFKDPSLVSLIERGLERNNNLLIARKNIEAAKLNFKRAKQGNMPEFDLLVTATSSRFSDNSLNGISTDLFLERKSLEDYQLQGMLSWEADIWGKIRRQTQTALAEYLQTGEASKALQTGIVASISKSYYNLLKLDAQLEVAKQNLQLSMRTKEIIDLQFASALVTTLAKDQATAQMKNAEQLIPYLEGEIAVEENLLSTLTGVAPRSIERGGFQENLPDVIKTGIPADLLGARPDVKAAELGIQAANGRVGVAKAMMYPSLRITASTGLSAFEAVNWFNFPGSVFGVVGGSLAQPVLNRRRLKTSLQTEQIQREQQVYTFQETVLTAVKEVSDALVRIEKTTQRQNIAFSRVEALEHAVENADLLFENGVANYLEVITAQGILLQSQLDLVEIKRDKFYASIDLYRALGGGWQ
ncbi:efflux transporter outer membrane subunit [Algoriphagus sp. AGSA1]|uniref:efflux transporter outer membrane subunit n=1 Tax=Algoriphagus sp. AGSA1 TaxID=2907213 RepID=UPI001F2DF614|nr:efflux transporter outer membrane subunit [Algoriphagus sp. AGSA1]MCE7053451.1 efflux transporter outer membrane subunit [Algoriphagus sp. AGSA1]